jgi:hypothetical protein
LFALFSFFSFIHLRIVKTKYNRLVYRHVLYLGQAEDKYISLTRSFHEHIVAFHLIKTYALIIERSYTNVIGLVFGHGAADGQLYTLNVRLTPHLLTGSAVHQRSISDRTILITYNVSHFLCECSFVHIWIYSNTCIWLSFCCRSMNMLSLHWQHVLTFSHYSHFIERLEMKLPCMFFF